MQQGLCSVGGYKQGGKEARAAALSLSSLISARLWAEDREEVLSQFPLLATQPLGHPHPPKEPTSLSDTGLSTASSEGQGQKREPCLTRLHHLPTLHQIL